MTRSIRTVASLAVLLATFAAQSVHAQEFDPNAPAKRTVTVGSEIKRGSSAVSATVHGLPHVSDVVATWRAVNNVIAQNQQH